MKPTVLKEVLSRPQVCARLGTDCSGRLTYEHAYGRRQEEAWQIVILCWRHHLGDLLDKRINHRLALRQATPEDLAKYPKCTEQWKRDLDYYNSIYK